MTEAESEEFTKAYTRYQECCDRVVKANACLHDTKKEASATTAKTPIAPVGQGIEQWDIAKVVVAAEAISRVSQAHIGLGRALQDQAEALRGTADLAEIFVQRVKEEQADG
jgi:hypothetical protein